MRWCSDGIWFRISIGFKEGKEMSFLQEPEGGEVDQDGLHPPRGHDLSQPAMSGKPGVSGAGSPCWGLTEETPLTGPLFNKAGQQSTWP